MPPQQTSKADNIAVVFSSDSSLLQLPESTSCLLQSSYKFLDVVKATIKQLLQQYNNTSWHVGNFCSMWN